MEPAAEIRRSRQVAGALALASLVMVGLGSYVRGTGAGLSCPDWPLCFGMAVPEFRGGVIQEVLHRYLALILSLLTFLVALRAFRARKTHPLFFKTSLFLVAVLVCQIILGGLTVLMTLNPFIVTAHLLFGTVFLQTAALIAIDGIGKQGTTAELSAGEKKFSGLVCLTAIGTFVQIVLGGFVGASGASLICQGFPLCNGSLLPEGATGAHMVQMLHRLLAFILLGLVIALIVKAKRSGPTISKRKGHIFGMTTFVVLQILIGVGNLHMKISPIMTVFHLIVAELLLLGLISLYRDIAVPQKILRSEKN